MDFSWSQEQQELYKQAYDYALKNLACKTNNSSPYKEPSFRESWNLCSQFGLTGGCVSKQYGGQGWDAVSTAFVLEAFAYAGADIGLLFSIAAHLFACVIPIAKYSSENVKNEILPYLCNGKYIGANAITEKEAGSDVFALASTADFVDDNYQLNGIKNYVTNGSIADVVLVYAKTNPNRGHWGVSAFLVKTSNNGIKLDLPFDKIGLNTAQASEVHLNQCKVPPQYRLGEEGDGALIFNYSMQWERSCLFAIYLGMMALQLDRTIEHTQNRIQFGKPLSEQPMKS